MPNIFLRPVFVGIVSAFGKDSQFPIHKMTIECDALFHVKKVAPVRI